MIFHIHDGHPCYQDSDGTHYHPVVFPGEIPTIKKAPIPKNVGDLLAAVAQLVTNQNLLIDALCEAGQIRKE